jgi:hypothetical protein
VVTLIITDSATLVASILHSRGLPATPANIAKVTAELRERAQ